MAAGDFIGCHQRSDRSFYYKKCQFPICARCTGVIIATIVVVPLFFRIRLSLTMSIILSGVMLLDWGIQYLGIKESTNIRRMITGIIGGVGWSTIHMYCYMYLFNLIMEYLFK